MDYSLKEIQTLSKNKNNFIREGDDNYFNQVYKVVESIIENHSNSPIILLSGPSGSGKTTTALNIERILDEKDIETHILSLDNYFKPFNEEERELYKEGKLDLESPDRVDSDLLNKQLQDLIDCKTIELFKYDFKESKRISTGEYLTRKKDELVILEGTHSLNPMIVALDAKHFIKIYVSVASGVGSGVESLDRYDIRLLRRIIRDKNFRARSIEETLSLKSSVDAGERKYIEPYKKEADYKIDSFILYELNAYKKIILNDLEKIDNDEVKGMVNILKSLTDYDEIIIPRTSLIREFIGKGSFHY